MQTPDSRRPCLRGAIDPALLRLLLLAFGVVLAIQIAVALCDFDYPGSDPYAKARAKIRLGKWDEAERIYRLRTISTPEDARGWLGLGDLLVLREQPGLYDEAARDYQNAAFGPPGVPASAIAAQDERTVALRQAGLLAGLRGERELSLGLLDQATASGDLPALRASALLRVVQGLRGADQVLQQAAISSPNDPALLYSVATGWQRNHHSARAHQVLAMLEAHPQIPDPNDHWQAYCHARYLMACGDQAGAASELARSIGVDAARMGDAVPLDRATVQADPAFQGAGAPVAAVLRSWRARAPWQVGDASAAVAGAGIVAPAAAAPPASAR
jgi:hypothetical protein